MHVLTVSSITHNRSHNILACYQSQAKFTAHLQASRPTLRLFDYLLPDVAGRNGKMMKCSDVRKVDRLYNFIAVAYMLERKAWVRQ